MPSSTIDLPTSEEDPNLLSFNWGDQYMVETPAFVEAYITMIELYFLQEYENHQVHLLVLIPF